MEFFPFKKIFKVSLSVESSFFLLNIDARQIIDCIFENRETNRIHSYLYHAYLFYMLRHAELSTATIGNDLGEFTKVSRVTIVLGT